MTPYEIIQELRKFKYSVKKVGYKKLEIRYFGSGEPDPEKIGPLLQELKDKKEQVLQLLEDPRPDLREDSHLWQGVLKKAKNIDNFMHGSLHGFRCAGCRLKLEGDTLRLYPSDHWKNKEEYNQDKVEYLIPHKEEIRQLFKDIAAEIKTSEKAK